MNVVVQYCRILDVKRRSTNSGIVLNPKVFEVNDGVAELEKWEKRIGYESIINGNKHRINTCVIDERSILITDTGILKGIATDMILARLTTMVVLDFSNRIRALVYVNAFDWFGLMLGRHFHSTEEVLTWGPSLRLNDLFFAFIFLILFLNHVPIISLNNLFFMRSQIFTLPLSNIIVLGFCLSASRGLVCLISVVWAFILSLLWRALSRGKLKRGSTNRMVSVERDGWPGRRNKIYRNENTIVRINKCMHTVSRRCR